MLLAANNSSYWIQFFFTFELGEHLFSTYYMLDYVQVLHSHHLSQFSYNPSGCIFISFYELQNWGKRITAQFHISSKWWSQSSIWSWLQSPGSFTTSFHHQKWKCINSQNWLIVINLVLGPNTSMIIIYIIHKHCVQDQVYKKAESSYDKCTKLSMCTC